MPTKDIDRAHSRFIAAVKRIHVEDLRPNDEELVANLDGVPPEDLREVYLWIEIERVLKLWIRRLPPELIESG